MAFNINDFRQRGLVLGGARPSLFEVSFSAGGGADRVGGLVTSATNIAQLDEKIKFSCQASSIPASTVGVIEVPYFGRKIKISGDRTFADWSVTILNDEDFVLRDMFENWLNLLNTHESNLRNVPSNQYKCDAYIRQFSKDGTTIREYRMIGMFPLEVSAMDVDWDATNRIQTFNVSLAYDYWVPVLVDRSNPSYTGTEQPKTSVTEPTR
jgi:hypothetical protein